MAIELKKLKDLSEEECFERRTGVLSAHVIAFLKENEGKAYTAFEMGAELNARNQNGKIKIHRNSLYSLLYNITKNPKTNVHKKGSYYYYEKEVD